MITKKKKSSINLSKKKLLGGASKPPRPKRASSYPLSIKKPSVRRHSAPEMGGKQKQGGTFEEYIKFKKEAAENLKKSPSAGSASSNEKIQKLKEQELVKMFLEPNNKIHNTRELNECLNFDTKKGAVGDIIDPYEIPSMIINDNIYEGYFVKVNVTNQTIGSIHLFLCKKYVPPENNSPVLECNEIHYIDELLANIIIKNNPHLTIPEFNITKGDQSVYTNRNIQNITRKSILSDIAAKKQLRYNQGLHDYCEGKFTKIKMLGYMAQCNITTYAENPEDTHIHPDLDSFGFDILDELKFAFKQFLKNKPSKGEAEAGAAAKQPGGKKEIISLLALRYAAVCNVIVKDILKRDYFMLCDAFSIYKEDETIDSKSLNKMGSMCLDIFNAGNYNHSLNLKVDAKTKIATLKPFKGIDFEFTLTVEFEIKDIKLVEDIITSVIKSFFNVDTYMELVDIYLKIMNEEESIEYIEIYHQILLNLKNPKLINDIASKFITKKKPRGSQQMSLSVGSKQEVEDFKSSFTYFIIILERIFKNAKARGLITEHFYKKIVKLSTQLGYYSILTQSELIEHKYKPGTYERVYFFNELG